MTLQNYKQAIEEAEEYLGRTLTWREISSLYLGETTKEKIKQDEAIPDFLSKGNQDQS